MIRDTAHMPRRGYVAAESEDKKSLHGKAMHKNMSNMIFSKLLILVVIFSFVGVASAIDEEEGVP
jgi:hypothetical protein